MYYNRFGNTVDYLVANFPEQVASMSMAQQNSIAQTQARIDRPCCPKYNADMVLPYINPNRPCCKRNCIYGYLDEMSKINTGFGNLNPNVLGSEIGGVTTYSASVPTTSFRFSTGGCCGK